MSDIRMPDAGFSITEGTVVKWYKRVGDPVREGDTVVAVETDKITVEIPAETSGVLSGILVEEGSVVRVGEVIGTIGETATTTSKTADAVPAAPGASPATVKGKERASKADDTIPAERRVSPAAKALARLKGVDIGAIETGSGPNGRIVKQDVLAFAAKMESAGPVKAGVPEGAGSAETVAFRPSLGASEAAASAPARTSAGAPRDAASGAAKRTEFTGWRKTIADRMERSAREIPRYTMSVDADVSGLVEAIERLRAKEEGLRLTYLPFMMKAMVEGIREVPSVNSHCDGKGYTTFGDVNIGIAVDLGEKLLVPVVKDVAAKSIRELAKELEGLIAKARADRLEPRDVEGGTITLTNVGMFHTVAATSIILPPQVAIVYMGFARDMPAVREGRIEIRTIMSFGATYDHRVVNGAAGGRFLKKVKECLEDIGAFLISLR